jgi:YVTN family beta-propeller protein
MARIRSDNSTIGFLQRVVIALFLAIILLGGFSGINRSHNHRIQADDRADSFKNFESPQIHPLALTPDRTRLLSVNSPDNRLSIFDLTGDLPRLIAEIPVGLEPVSVAARNDREAWVVNWLSDTVSVVDLIRGNVIRTIDVGDEPTDILFAGLSDEKAFVCLAGLEQVKVFNPEDPSQLPDIIDIRGKQPRSLARDLTGGRVFVSVFESGNQTTVISADNVQEGGGLPKAKPRRSKLLPKEPNVGLILKFNGKKWADETGDTRWDRFVPYRLADVDLAVIDAGRPTPELLLEVRGVGTHIGNAVLDPTTNLLYVGNTESLNLVRFEPNLKGRFIDNRVTIVNFNNREGQVRAVDLNQHIDYSKPEGTDAERNRSLSIPADILRSSNGNIYIAATGSARVGVLDPKGSVINRIPVGQGPTGLAIDEKQQRLYVLNRFDQDLSVVDIETNSEIARISIGFNPEPLTVKNGRRFLYDANLSSHGTVSCANCHRSGHWDGLAWDLGNPRGKIQRVRSGIVESVFHPMKGPMTTQSLRGLSSTEPLHWRGDRADIKAFNGTFVDLLGGQQQLSTEELEIFAAFVNSITYPPNPNENLDRTYPDPPTGASPARGFNLFVNQRLDGRVGGNGVISCNTCHTAAPGFGTGTAKLIIPGLLLGESQDFKIPQLRGIYQKTGMINAPGEHLRGFGFIHDGTFDTLLTFLRIPLFNFKNDDERRDVEAFILAFDTGTAPAVGAQLTLDGENKTSTPLLDKLRILVVQAETGNANLIVKGIFGGVSRGFVYTGGGMFQTDKMGEPQVSLQSLIQAANKGSELTFTGVPLGTGRRIGIDRDNDGIPDGSDNSPSDPQR